MVITPRPRPKLNHFRFASSRRIATICLIGLFLPMALATADTPAPAIIPLPVKMEVKTGVFTVTPETVIVADEASKATARQLSEFLKPATGFALAVTSQAPADAKASITLVQDQALARLGKEGYQLIVTPAGIRIAAAGQVGLFYGVQTLRQLLPPEIFSESVPAKAVMWSMPCVVIEDQPRFAWRGLMLDSGHDFQRKEFVKRFIDLMALHKLNLFHWHLTDLGTWSLEIKGRPKLLEAVTRAKNIKKPGFYSQDEIREVVSYAAARHITILPEIEMPGHSPPALIAYPELDCPTPYPAGWPGNGGPWEFCVSNEKTYAFLEEVLSQVAGLFPGPYVHVGGDECPKKHWLSCPSCQAKMKAENLKTGEELQSYFFKRIGKFLESKNRRMIGWGEILEGGLAPKATVMSWLGMNAGITAAKAGHDVVMAPTTWAYFDNARIPVESVYGFEPIPKELTAEQAVHVLGAQAQMWTDSHPSEDRIDALVYPRAAAFSEVVWSAAASRNYDAFAVRLQAHLRRLATLGVHFKPLFIGTTVGRWDVKKKQEKQVVMEWPLADGLKGAGRYDVMFRYEEGSARLMIYSVEIIQDGKVLATDKHFGFSGVNGYNNEYQVKLPELSDMPLTLRATVSTDREDSRGRILIEKMP